MIPQGKYQNAKLGVSVNFRLGRQKRPDADVTSIMTEDHVYQSQHENIRKTHHLMRLHQTDRFMAHLIQRKSAYRHSRFRRNRPGADKWSTRMRVKPQDSQGSQWALLRILFLSESQHLKIFRSFPCGMTIDCCINQNKQHVIENGQI